MDAFFMNVTVGLQAVSKHLPKLSNYLSKEMWSPGDRDAILESLSDLLLSAECTKEIAIHFRAIILDLILRGKKRIVTKDYKIRSHLDHQKFCISLSKILLLCPEISSVTLDYLLATPPFYSDQSDSGEPQRKKSRKSKGSSVSQVEILEAILVFMQKFSSELREKWSWTDLVNFINSPNIEVKWLAVKIVSTLLSLSPSQQNDLVSKCFSDEQCIDLAIRFDTTLNDTLERTQVILQPDQDPTGQPPSGQMYTIRHILHSDLSDDLVISICGILLPKESTIQQNIQHPLVPVTTTQRCLRSLAMAVVANRPALLEGPVGSGKTALVEHLASQLGKGSAPGLIKIQLGDQTDSKALLGTYRCTEIPGEFVWQPGSLTVAVTQGHWVLLEDIDYAPMDVVSTLVPLLETGVLSLPGHGDEIRPHPSFRLFASRRLLSSGSTLFKQSSTGAALLEKLWSRVIVEPLSSTELQQVIEEKHPQLSTVAPRLVEIYLLLSSGRHEQLSEQNGDGTDAVTKYLPRDGRLISTRDLMKWVDRVSLDFDVTKSSTANLVFQEAIDCFCACIMGQGGRRLPLAEAIGAKLNITQSKAEYYCSKYKPLVDITDKSITVGRVTLPCKTDTLVALKRAPPASYALTRQASSLLERVAVATAHAEPVLLVGETGTGKTASVQHLASLLGHQMSVLNLNQQSDSSQLLGGFKPVDIRLVVAPFKEDFELLFQKTFSQKQNAKFLSHIQECFGRKRWKDLFQLMKHTLKTALKKSAEDAHLNSQWKKISRRLHQLLSQVNQSDNALAFSFIEGTLVKALKRGDWILLDEINLASAETLECLSGLLESASGSVVLIERGDTEPIVRHPDFRLFACMNPATDVGKKDLPPGIRNRFTEFYVDELDDPQDLKTLVAEYLRGLSLSGTQIGGIVKFYLTIRNEASKKLTDGTGHKPHFSLRTLCRALRQSALNKCRNVQRSLYEGFCLSFLTQLDRASHPVVESLICQHVLGKTNVKSILKQPIPEPTDGGKYLQFEGYWISVGDLEPEVPDGYILTPSVRANLRDLARVVSAGRNNVLLQGETSVGKTSLINWLAKSSGNTCMRINNHDHTDMQEYVGCYAADHTGKLAFKEGVLVEAMRKGHWVILDELNLAPTDVLEALNRVLDDNRELMIPETQEVIKAHPKFMLFATQNPPGLYGGRKVLSRAFRNRFVELHFDEIPSSELETILHQRCCMPMSYCRKLVAVMLELQTRRRGSGVFAGKQGFITLRDLFRWAERYHLASSAEQKKFFDWDQLLADNGYMLLAGRVRRNEETLIIQEVLEKHLKRKVHANSLFDLHDGTSPTTRPILEAAMQAPPADFGHIVWTHNMRRMAALVGQALKFGEPVLLVGDTGCGKTTICQLFAALNKQSLHSINCHMHTETADFLGGLRPVRQHSEDDLRLFEWVDGPLVTALNEGSIFLMDEISLADDSVLERLNSVLEPERTLLLAEKGGGDDSQVIVIVAKESFRMVSTMNPGGDFGKKELSPALRNRMTEIWCPQSSEREDLTRIMSHNLISLPNPFTQNTLANAAMDFVSWFSNNQLTKRSTVSIRDLLSWVHFINATARSDEAMEVDEADLHPGLAYVHGACMVFLDAVGMGATGGLERAARAVRESGMSFLRDQMRKLDASVDFSLEDCPTVHSDLQMFGLKPFFIQKGNETIPELSYALDAPTTAKNAGRLMRAMQLTRPLLLEGSPGVGKTSLVAALAKCTGHELVRINLSQQTDVSDLFGTDLPVEGGSGGQFAWRDGPLLQALKSGHWVVLDELNLASQSVLEGLNACLDHRGEVYIPELGRSFFVQKGKTRLFGCQNPLHQGGGRKGLPRSFLNRFTQVYVEPLTPEDLLFIASSMYPQIPKETLETMVTFNQTVDQMTNLEMRFGHHGAPWEFNLRDVFRWCDLLIRNQAPGMYDPQDYVGLIYVDRMRTSHDKTSMEKLYASVAGSTIAQLPCSCHISSCTLQVGRAFMLRRQVPDFCHVGAHDEGLLLLHRQLKPLESLMLCVQMKWMAILVGPSGSGKSSLVQLLAQLSGHPLHTLPMNSSMDTTELLGGFEQADLKRHVEAVIVKVQSLVYEVSAGILTANGAVSAPTVFKIMQTWMKFKRSSIDASSTQQSHADELVFIKSRIDSLAGILDVLHRQLSSPPEEVSARINDLTTKLAKLKEDLSREQGGRFEWIDSVLVQALQQGHWLLIDNVNFCSASVLDRLNGLLEPQGVLSINERGVIDGQVPAIEPHPDFRLILAMDPRNGEISRAMRNRGVEIYMSGENDDGAFNQRDLQQLIRHFGLLGHTPASVLHRLHCALQSAQSAATTEPLTLSHLWRAVQLICQEIEHGAGLRSAMKQACVEVYVRGSTSRDSQLAFTEIIDEHLQNFDLKQTEAASLLEPGLWPESPVDTLALQNNVNLCNIKKNCDLFLHFIDQIAIYSGSKLLQLSASESVDPSLVGEILPLLMPALVVLLENVGPKYWKMTQIYLLTHIRNRLGDHVEVDCKIPRDVLLAENISTAVELCLQVIGQHPLLPLLAQCLKHAVSDETASSACLEESYDPRWNSELLKHCRLALIQNGQLMDNDQWLKVTGLCNQLWLSVYSQLLSVCHMPKDNGKPAKKKSLAKRRDVTMMQLSTLFHSGHLGVDRLPDQSLVHLQPFVTLMHDHMTRALSCDILVTDDLMSELRDGLLWWCRFLDVCHEVMNQENKDITIASLALHWNWMHSRLLPLLSDALQCQFSKELQVVFEQLQNSLGGSRELSRAQNAVWRAFGSPSPHTNKTQVEILTKVRALWNALQPNMTQSELMDAQRVERLISLMLKEGNASITFFFNILSQARNSAEDESILQRCLEEIIAKTEEISTAHNLHLNHETQDAALVDAPVMDLTKLAMLPLHSVLCETGSWLSARYQFERCAASQGSAVDAQWLRYSSSNTLMSPLSLLQWNSPMQDSKALISALCGLLIEALKESSQLTTTAFEMVKWVGNKHSEEEEVTTAQPKLLACCQPAFTSAVVPLIHEAIHLRSKDSRSMLSQNISLGCYQEKMAQLLNLSNLLWSNGDLLQSPQWDVLQNAGRLLIHAFCHLVISLAEIADCKDSVCPLVQTLEENAEASLNGLRDFMLTSSPIQILVPEYETLVPLCCESLSKIAKAKCHWEKVRELGQAWLHFGILQCALLVPQGPVDPVHKLAVKMGYTKEELQLIENELRVRNWNQKLATGQDLIVEGQYKSQLHPVVQHLLTRRQQLLQWLENHVVNVAYRPPNSQFPQLLRDVHQFQSTVANPQLRLLPLLNKLCDALESEDKSAVHTALSEQMAWDRTTRQFLSSLQTNYVCYHDLLLPFMAGVVAVQSGLQWMAAALEVSSSLETQLPPSKQLPLEELVKNLATFPRKESARKLAGSLVHERTLGLFEHLDKNADRLDDPQSLTSRVLKMSLLLIKHDSIMKQTLDSSANLALVQVLQVFVRSWHASEMRRKAKQAEKDSLYKYKETVHGDESTQEERDAREIKEMFPSFDHDFAEFAEVTLEKKPEEEEAEEGEEKEHEIALNEEEMWMICCVHGFIYSRLSQLPWYSGSRPDINKEVDFVGVVSAGHQVACDVVASCAHLMDNSVDSELIASHLFVTQILQSSVSAEDSPFKARTTDAYDIYRDANVVEVVQCRPLLEALHTRSAELLAEWPDHPTLKQIEAVINRILRFPVTAPLMKYVTGVEILLEKAQEWQKNAARHVSLSAQIEPITQLLIQWRSLELQCWRSCLDTVALKHKQKASKWWFHLYNLLNSFCYQEEDDEGSMTADGLLEALQSFMETANVGDYQMRLDLIMAFMCQVAHETKTPQQEIATRMLWNLHAYYKQFISCVQEKLNKLKTPIEKDIKDFVKIARWNDINFYAVKKAVEKTHRTLHKHMKQFTEVLCHPVRSLLLDPLDTKSEQSPPSLDCAVFITKKIQSEEEAMDQSDVVGRISHFSKKMRRHCKGVIQRSSYTPLVTSLETFTAEIIESSRELQSLQPTQDVDKKKQKSEAKLIHQRKRKALADLFRYLQTLGLSHRKGLTSLKSEEKTVVAEAMQSPAIDIECGLKQSSIDPATDHVMGQQWEGCGHYFHKSLARRALLHVLAQKPAQDLGASNIERCKGFTEHLLLLLKKQKNQLGVTFEKLLNLRKLMCQVKRLEALPPQTPALRWMTKLKSTVDETIDSLMQFGILLQCCPPQPKDGECVLLTSRNHLSEAACWHQGHDDLLATTSMIQGLCADLLSVKKSIDASATADLYIDTDDVTIMQRAADVLKKVSTALSGIKGVFQLNDQCHPLASVLASLPEELLSVCSEFESWHPEAVRMERRSDGSAVFRDDLNQLITEVMLVIQDFVKRNNVPEEEVKKDKEVNEEEEGDLQEKHLTQSILKDLATDVDRLRMDNISQRLQLLLTKVVENAENCRPGVGLMLMKCLPALETYGKMAEFYVTQIIRSQRATAKLLSVLLGIFNELTEKGFCLPKDYDEEEAQEGATQFEDIEGGGLGEGEGAKDVSDQIENEDQLEDTKQKGQEDEEQEEQEQPELKSEDNAVEMSDDFDGKMHDMDTEEGEEGSEEEKEEEDPNDLDKEMGDLGDGDTEKLDDQIWGSDEEEEEEEESKDESGAGSGQQEESELVAKEGNEEGEEEKKEKKNSKDENEEKTNEQEHFDEQEYDENEVDPHKAQAPETQEAEPMELPDDLNLDEDAADKGEEEEGGEHPDDNMESQEDESKEDEENDKGDEEMGQEEKDAAEEDSKEHPDVENMENPLAEDDEGDKDAADPGKGVDPDEVGNEEAKNEAEQESEETPQAAETAGKSSHDSNAQQCDQSNNSAGQNENKDDGQEGSGMAETEQEEGHTGADSTHVTRGQSQQQLRASQRKQGQSNQDRSLANESMTQKKLQTIDNKSQEDGPDEDSQKDPSADQLYEHVKNQDSKHDEVTMDAATEDQTKEQPRPNKEEENGEELTKDDKMEIMDQDEEHEGDEENQSKDMTSMRLKIKSDKSKMHETERSEEPMDEGDEGMDVAGQRVDTVKVDRGLESSYHTSAEFLDFTPGELNIEKLRLELEQNLTTITEYNPEQEASAMEAWQQYEALTASLSQDLCEQLRLVLEPTQASKMRGDYRTGKRLNMRKVIPYIASQFRKDKIWLRRTQPSKREYQVMVAVDDSSSMADNHSKQLAFESLCVIANALSLLEVGEMSVCSFGESVKLLHPLHEQFTAQSGGKLLQQFTFDQKKTKVAELLRQVTGVMMKSRQRQQGTVSHPDTSQLLLIVSDGRGLFLEGVDTVKAAVRQAREAKLFVVFVIIDSPTNKDSILDIRVPLFKPGNQLPEIRSYLDSFPFPFYVILRDINSLPHTLSDALRQWFELVTAADA